VLCDFSADNLNHSGCLIHGKLHREDIAKALWFDGFEPTPVGLGRSAHRLLGYTPLYWGNIRREGEHRSRHAWPPPFSVIATSRPADRERTRARRGRATRRSSRSQAPEVLQRQVTFAHIPEIPTAIPIQEASTSGRASVEEEEEFEEEAFDHRAVIQSLTEQGTRLADSDDSPGYSPSPDREDMSRRPINLLDTLTLGGASRAPPTARTAIPPPVPSPVSLTDRQREKRPADSPQDAQPSPQRRRTDGPNSTQQLPESPPLIQHWAPVLARPSGAPLTVIDKISSTDVAYGVSRAALLPNDMEREKNSSYDVLMKTIFQSSIKVRSLVTVFVCKSWFLYLPP
jgi:hypothetical protein